MSTRIAKGLKILFTITLEVTGVMAQRLQDISEADAQAEGIAELPLQAGQPGAWWSADPAQPALHGRTAVDAFRLLWESIYGQGSWSDNPMVWAISSQLIHSVNPLAIST
jgi:hypothetical protein